MPGRSTPIQIVSARRLQSLGILPGLEQLARNHRTEKEKENNVLERKAEEHPEHPTTATSSTDTTEMLSVRSHFSSNVDATEEPKLLNDEDKT